MCCIVNRCLILTNNSNQLTDITLIQKFIRMYMTNVSKLNYMYATLTFLKCLIILHSPGKYPPPQSNFFSLSNAYTRCSPVAMFPDSKSSEKGVLGFAYIMITKMYHYLHEKEICTMSDGTWPCLQAMQCQDTLSKYM